MRLALLAGLFMTAALPAFAGILPTPIQVPEPATVAVLAAGVGALLVARRRK